MMGRTHALSGLVAGVAAGHFWWHLDAPHLAVAAAVTAGAAVLPDIDHPDGSVAYSFGFVTKGFAWVIGHVSGGHRHGTHSLAGIAAFTGAAYVAEHYRRTLGGKIALGLLLVLVLAAGLRALKIGGHFGDPLAIGGSVSDAPVRFRRGRAAVGDRGRDGHPPGRGHAHQRGHTDRLAVVPAAHQAAPGAAGVYHWNLA
jgi:hypothetical protein